MQRSIEHQELADIMLSLQQRGCHNINLVSPSHVAPQIISAIFLAAKQGLRLPVVYNTGGYDSLRTLELLDGIIDIYMPDMKYADENIALQLSGISRYPAVNQSAVKEMHRQVGDLKINTGGITHRGLLVRHLVLPNNLAGTSMITRFLAEEISRNTSINIMGQYHPDYIASQNQKINRRITIMEYQAAMSCALHYGLQIVD